MLEQIRAAISAALAKRAAEQQKLDDVVTAAEAEDRTDLTAEETTTFAEARKALGEIDTELEGLRAREAELVEIAEARAAADRIAADLPDRPTPASTVRVGEEPLTYRRGGRHDFLQDAYNARYNHDPAAAQRLVRSNEEMVAEYRDAGVEVRDVGTSAYGALVVPQYLTDLAAKKRRAGRKFLDTINGNVDLPPEGMTVEIPRITTGTAVAVQATQGSAVQETDIDETTLSVPVRTFAGQQDVSRQAIERGRMVEEITVDDLIRDYHAKVDASAIKDDGTSGTHLGVLQTSGINAVTYTDASPTVGELYSKVADAIQRAATNDFADVDHIWLHPRRWGWITAALDSAGRPLVQPNGSAMNIVAFNENPGKYSVPVVGEIQGLPVTTDANIPTNLGAGTNEDAIIIGDSALALILEEDGHPLYLRFEETNGAALQVKLVVYGYSAFTAGRYPASFSAITGTGLVTPTF